MKQKFSNIRTPWRRLVLSVVMHCLLWINQFTSPRARIHWIGRYKRPRRPERTLFVLAFFGSMLLMEVEQFLLWSTVWGGTFAMFINLHIVYYFIPRKRAHWIR